MKKYNRNSGALALRHCLRRVAVEALEAEGWVIEKVAGNRKSSIRRITKGKESQLVAIRTSQDAHLGFDRNADDAGWRTLDEVESVIVSALDLDDPKFAMLHRIPADKLRSDWYDPKRDARKAVGGQGERRQNWIPLYRQHAAPRYDLLRKYLGEAYPAFARVPLKPEVTSTADGGPTDKAEHRVGIIEQKKRELAAELGVAPSSIRITIEA